jgi:hypothetical protein
VDDEEEDEEDDEDEDEEDEEADADFGAAGVAAGVAGIFGACGIGWDGFAARGWPLFWVLSSEDHESFAIFFMTQSTFVGLCSTSRASPNPPRPRNCFNSSEICKGNKRKMWGERLLKQSLSFVRAGNVSVIFG